MGETRRCAHCGLAALHCVHRWQHHLLGIATPSFTLEHACAGCGAKVTLHPAQKIRAERLFACLMIPAIFPSLYFFASARRKARAWADNPVVAVGIVAPIRREPPRRACLCGAAAPCTEIGRKATRFMELGRRCEHACDRCGRVFTVYDGRAISFLCVAGTVLAAFGTLILFDPPGRGRDAVRSNLAFGVALIAVAAFTWLLAALRIRNRLAHPHRPSG